MDRAAFFSCDRRHRYFLARIWDKSLPSILFIGLNPSKADEKEDDPTIKRVIAISKNLGYGSVYMANLFSYVSTNPDDLITEGDQSENDKWLFRLVGICSTVVYAWGSFKQAKERGSAVSMFFSTIIKAKALHINADGSPKHPLYCRVDSQLVEYNTFGFDMSVSVKVNNKPARR